MTNAEDKTVMADLLVSVFDSGIALRSALYCSAPVSSGQRYLQWLRDGDHGIRDVDHAMDSFGAEHTGLVVQPNIQHAKEVVERMRATYAIPVIDPSAVASIKSWRQADWLEFWERVVARFAIAVVFVDGWQFSFGCTHEFLFARRQGLPTFDERGAPLVPAIGILLIEQAIEESSATGVPVDRLEAVVAKLRSAVWEKTRNDQASLAETLSAR